MSNKKLTVPEIYERIPDINCKGLCHESCGPIAMSPVEEARIESKTRQPAPSIKNVAADFSCCRLDEQKLCSIYTHRPLVCRLFGVVKAMRCPHGCEPNEWLPEPQARKLQKALDKIPPRSSRF